VAIGPKKMAGEGEAGGIRWRGGRGTILLLARSKFFWLVAIFAPIIGGRPFASFLSNIRM